jgi:hypothetical protein
MCALLYSRVQSTRLLNALRLLSRVASLSGDLQRRLVADTEMLLLCNSLQQSQKALECIKQTEAWLNDCDVGLKFPRLHVEFMLAKAEALLLANQVSG